MFDEEIAGDFNLLFFFVIGATEHFVMIVIKKNIYSMKKISPSLS